jgi:hypothetical protein
VIGKNIITYPMRPGEALWQAIIHAAAIAASSGAQGYQVLDVKGNPIPPRRDYLDEDLYTPQPVNKALDKQ